MDEKLDLILYKLEGIDNRLDHMGIRLDNMNIRLDNMDTRLDNMDTHFDNRLEHLETQNDSFELKHTTMEATLLDLKNTINKMECKQDVTIRKLDDITHSHHNLEYTTKKESKEIKQDLDTIVKILQIKSIMPA